MSKRTYTKKKKNIGKPPRAVSRPSLVRVLSVFGICHCFLPVLAKAAEGKEQKLAGVTKKAAAPKAAKAAGVAAAAGKNAPAKKGGKGNTPATLAKDKALKTKQAVKKGLITTRRRKVRTAITFRLPKTLKTARKPKFPRLAVPHRPR